MREANSSQQNCTKTDCKTLIRSGPACAWLRQTLIDFLMQAGLGLCCAFISDDEFIARSTEIGLMSNITGAALDSQA